jgi:ubiquinone/menaquinone biosynthesis C-methylase UbiE
MIRFRRGTDPHTLAVSMTGVKMGDRMAHIGCPDGGRLAAIAAKVGLSGRAVAIVSDATEAARARKGAAQAGVLVEVEVAAPDALPLDKESIDLLVVDDTGGMLARAPEDQQHGIIQDALRVLRPGGRLMVIGAGSKEGLAALLARPATPPFDATPVLEASGMRSVRTLAEREGLRFAEGMKPRTP